MSMLVVNIPPIKVWVRKEYLRDLVDGHGEFVEGYWVTAKSISGRAFYFETYLPEYGALYDKLPISAFVSSPETPSPDMGLEDLQFWNAMDYEVMVIQKSFIANMDVECRTKHHGVQKGQYLFTLDNYHSNSNMPDLNVSEIPNEHKSHNVIELDNGQYAIYPNNRMRLFEMSLTPEHVKNPDFKVSTHYFEVEHGNTWGRLGDTDEYFWKVEGEE
jgi:hypothetical protein